MKCPICKLDLSPLDFLSRTEHVDLCVENGPSVLDISESGQLVLRKNIPPNKQRKICPLCDKTFQSIQLHYKKCAIKHDILPDLMLDHWNNFNMELNTTKKFPCDLLENFISRRINEGRNGEQVDYARALLVSMSESQPNAGKSRSTITNQPQYTSLISTVTDESEITSNSMHFDGQQREQSLANSSTLIDPIQDQPPTMNQVSMQNRVFPTMAPRSKQSKPQKKFKIELVDDVVKKVNIDLRFERELAASSERRYETMQKAIEEKDIIGESSTTREDKYTICWLDRLS